MLHQTRFPNPPHPLMAGTVGFSDRDHTMTDDVAEMWWSDSAQSPYEDDVVGAFCYVDNGARRRAGALQRDAAFFAGPCHSEAA